MLNVVLEHSASIYYPLSGRSKHRLPCDSSPSVPVTWLHHSSRDVQLCRSQLSRYAVSPLFVIVDDLRWFWPSGLHIFLLLSPDRETTSL